MLALLSLKSFRALSRLNIRTLIRMLRTPPRYLNRRFQLCSMTALSLPLLLLCSLPLFSSCSVFFVYSYLLGEIIE